MTATAPNATASLNEAIDTNRVIQMFQDAKQRFEEAKQSLVDAAMLAIKNEHAAREKQSVNIVV